MTGLISGWAALPADERKARLRSLQGITRCCCGPATAKDLLDLLRRAENDNAALPLAEQEFLRLHARAQRRVLSTFALTLPAFRGPKRRNRQREIADTFREAGRPGRAQ